MLSGDFHNPNLEGIQITQAALSTHIGESAGTFVAIAIFMFAFSSIIGNYYYGETNIEFIHNNRLSLFLYRVAVIAMVIIGSTASLDFVWLLADIFMAFMAIINLIAITLLYKVAIHALKDYQKQRQNGKNPIFYADSIPGLSKVEWWHRNDGHKSELK